MREGVLRDALNFESASTVEVWRTLCIDKGLMVRLTRDLLDTRWTTIVAAVSLLDCRMHAPALSGGSLLMVNTLWIEASCIVYIELLSFRVWFELRYLSRIRLCLGLSWRCRQVSCLWCLANLVEVVCNVVENILFTNGRLRLSGRGLGGLCCLLLLTGFRTIVSMLEGSWLPLVIVVVVMMVTELHTLLLWSLVEWAFPQWLRLLISCRKGIRSWLLGHDWVQMNVSSLSPNHVMMMVVHVSQHLRIGWSRLNSCTITVEWSQFLLCMRFVGDRSLLNRQCSS